MKLPDLMTYSHSAASPRSNWVGYRVRLRPARRFTTAAAPGFDALRIYTGSRADFVRNGRAARGRRTGCRCSRRRRARRSATRVRNASQQRARARGIFYAFFEFASTFEGEVFTSNSDALPQTILPGDASDAIATNSLRVLSAEGGSVDFVRDLQRSTGVLTPNGDGVNDQLTLRYALFRLLALCRCSKSILSTGTA